MTCKYLLKINYEFYMYLFNNTVVIFKGKISAKVMSHSGYLTVEGDKRQRKVTTLREK